MNMPISADGSALASLPALDGRLLVIGFGGSRQSVLPMLMKRIGIRSYQIVTGGHGGEDRGQHDERSIRALRHHVLHQASAFPKGRRLRMPALALGMLYYQLLDWLSR